MSGSVTEPILIEELEENLVDDPYGTAMFVCRNVLHRALAHSNAMSDREFKNLLSIEESLRAFGNE